MAAASMDGGRRGVPGRRGARRVSRSAARPCATAIAIVLTLLVARALAKKPSGDDVHRADGDCRACHTADAAALKQDPAAAKTALAADLEARCGRCHDEGPSHRT